MFDSVHARLVQKPKSNVVNKESVIKIKFRNDDSNQICEPHH